MKIQIKELRPGIICIFILKHREICYRRPIGKIKFENFAVNSLNNSNINKCFVAHNALVR